MSERERPSSAEPEAHLPEISDELHSYRSTWSREPEAVCWVRVFDAPGQTPVIIMSELPQNWSFSTIRTALGGPCCNVRQHRSPLPCLLDPNMQPPTLLTPAAAP